MPNKPSHAVTSDLHMPISSSFPAHLSPETSHRAHSAAVEIGNSFLSSGAAYPCSERTRPDRADPQVSPCAIRRETSACIFARDVGAVYARKAVVGGAYGARACVGIRALGGDGVVVFGSEVESEEHL